MCSRMALFTITCCTSARTRTLDSLPAAHPHPLSWFQNHSGVWKLKLQSFLSPCAPKALVALTLIVHLSFDLSIKWNCNCPITGYWITPCASNAISIIYTSTASLVLWLCNHSNAQQEPTLRTFGHRGKTWPIQIPPADQSQRIMITAAHAVFERSSICAWLCCADMERRILEALECAVDPSSSKKWT